MDLTRATKVFLNYRVVLTFILAALLYSFLAPIWMDPDGVYNLAAAIKGASRPLAIYDEWRFGPFYYGWGPFYSWLLLLVHPLFKLLGFTADAVWQGWAFNPFSYFIFKWLTKVPFILLGGYFCYKAFDLKAAVMWLFNPLIIWFVVMAGLNDIYPAFFLLLGLYFLKEERLMPFIICVGMGLVSKQTVSLALPALAMMLLFSRKTKAVWPLVLLFLPNFIFTFPYKYYSSGYKALMEDNFWQRLSVHLGFLFQQNMALYSTNLIIFSLIIVLLIMVRPKLNLLNFCLWSVPFFLVYILSAGRGMERWTLTMLPLLIVITVALAKLFFNKGIYWVFWILSFLPPLIQFGWRDAQFKMKPENYTLFENTSIPFRLLNLFSKPELSPIALSYYLVSVQAGVIIAYLLMMSYAIYKITTGSSIELGRGSQISLGQKIQLTMVYLVVFLAGAFILYASYAHKIPAH